MADVSLALIERAPAGLGKPQPRDRNLWLMKKRGWTDEQLAVRFGMKEAQVKLSIDRYMLYRDGFANEELDLDINRMMVSKILPKVEKVLLDGMSAQHTVMIGKGKNAIRQRVTDHATRLKSVEIAKSLMETTRPRGGGIQINTQVNAAAEQQVVREKGFDFESRLRDIRAKKGLDVEDNVIDGEFEDEQEDALAAELADIGIDLEEDEDDDEEEDDD